GFISSRKASRTVRSGRESDKVSRIVRNGSAHESSRAPCAHSTSADFIAWVTSEKPARRHLPSVFCRDWDSTGPVGPCESFPCTPNLSCLFQRPLMVPSFVVPGDMCDQL